ncbi:MAG: NAD-dependent deacylase [Chloroflexota bacterium]
MINHFVHESVEILAQANHVTCLTGAGVSAESGVATFRDPQSGHWSKFDPEQLASQTGFRRDPGLVWRWYMERLSAATRVARPNPGHIALAELARMVSAFTLITQNVDNLHEQAGSQDVIHLHGNISDFFCNGCRKTYALQEEERTAEMPPTCSHCGDMVRPGVVWFGEQLPAHEIHRAWEAAQTCDVMLVVGTSGIVYPAAHLPYLAQDRNATVIDVNPEEDALSAMADIHLAGPSGQILPQIVAVMKNSA